MTPPLTERVNPLRDPRDRRLPRIAGPCVLVIFGVTGDLSTKKLMPAVYDLANRGLLPPGFALVGFARRDWEHEDFAKIVHDAVKQHARTPFREEVWRQLSEGIRFVSGQIGDGDSIRRLRDTIAELDEARGTGGNHAFYLSIPPGLFQTVVDQLREYGLAEQRYGQWSRVVIEKPFGHDLTSARELNRVVSSVFPSSSVFRIDHYLGKETVQNMMALRFANQLFEPVWNNNYVDHVQITMAEDIGIGGRAGYFDGIGIARDVIQNHLLQLLALTAMEEPTSFEAAQLRAEKQKVLAAARPAERMDLHTARGRYAGGWQGGVKVASYLEEKGIPRTSTTETFAAIRVDIDNRRWAGVPFYLRTGKRLARRVTEIALGFKRAPHLPFSSTDTAELGYNALVLRIQPDEGVTLRFGAKVPGTQMEIREVNMDFAYGGSFTESSPEAYERLILDVLLGDPPLFPQHEEVELSWQILDPVLDYWASLDEAPESYEPGGWGPACANEMLARDGHVWRRP
ncbi:glucose-6-phosphate 1-dehydrogenase [Microlunatus phosphovorus NM-1]|uniref:Glucose-6-phosphate 1-dehydrogenase n=1 Tax=Microlunatus phosphovorus (strain ATCC 700054 / DSM 10555 / JCM 9379 / NBRC 101784 / NCIMB 13414 / VKM Ac-1990 / NM-1) TaxID=1032480 RepID=F5XQD9_MICPN|nr:glucose-6-phosphate dehydrogenase [Microlunatus phosphovorus]BAK34439.1 glucose-6-phosphate 1-dehydrogenase [Microlunatus phosphovorus NM-1]